jgi:hypothetical protein
MSTKDTTRQSSDAPSDKIVYEAAENGNWERTAYARRGCEWRPVGTETVSGLRVDDDRPQTRAFRGPE